MSTRRRGGEGASGSRIRRMPALVGGARGGGIDRDPEPQPALERAPGDLGVLVDTAAGPRAAAFAAHHEHVLHEGDVDLGGIDPGDVDLDGQRGRGPVGEVDVHRRARLVRGAVAAAREEVGEEAVDVVAEHTGNLVEQPERRRAAPPAARGRPAAADGRERVRLPPCPGSGDGCWEARRRRVRRGRGRGPPRAGGTRAGSRASASVASARSASRATRSSEPESVVSRGADARDPSRHEGFGATAGVTLAVRRRIPPYAGLSRPASTISDGFRLSGRLIRAAR